MESNKPTNSDSHRMKYGNETGTKHSGEMFGNNCPALPVPDMLYTSIRKLGRQLAHHGC